MVFPDGAPAPDATSPAPPDAAAASPAAGPSAAFPAGDAAAAFPALDASAAGDAAVGASAAGRSRRLVLGVALGAVLLLGGTVALAVTAGPDEPLGRPATAATTSAAPASPPTPFDAATQALDAQAKALLAGDEKGWLAAVDPKQPKLVGRYRSLYRHLRGLEVSHFAYHTFMVDAGKAGAGAVGVGADIAYCFSMDACPEYSREPWDGPPRISQLLTIESVAGRYVITKLAKAKEPNDLQPTPWENTELVFARGTRVTVAAPRSQAKHLARVLPVAEKAAAASDRFAGFLGTPQKRYRVYLADKKAWRSWYGGEKGKWTIAYAVPLNEAQTDVVLNAGELVGDRELLDETIRHEMGHVVTLSGVTMRDHEEDLWLSEGIAEYIGSAPRAATSSWRRASVRATVRSGRKPATIAVAAPGEDASAREGDAFYGLGHFAVDCMAQTYGERKMFDFVRLALRQDNTYDQASREAFGKPFATVDKTCVRWIRKRA
jgi:hypothetical protein